MKRRLVFVCTLLASVALAGCEIPGEPFATVTNKVSDHDAERYIINTGTPAHEVDRSNIPARIHEITFDGGLPAALNDTIQQCNDLPLRVDPTENPRVELAPNCNNDELAAIVEPHLSVEHPDTRRRWAVLIAGFLQQMEFNLGAEGALPEVLSEGQGLVLNRRESLGRGFGYCDWTAKTVVGWDLGPDLSEDELETQFSTQRQTSASVKLHEQVPRLVKTEIYHEPGNGSSWSQSGGCADGGVLVGSGLDNGPGNWYENGILNSTERTDSSGTSGWDVSTRPNGEVTNTKDYCHASTEDGFYWATVHTSEIPEGGVCEFGGTQVDVGWSRTGEGLSDEFPTETWIECDRMRYLNAEEEEELARQATTSDP